MTRRPKLRPLPEPERRQALADFLKVLDADPLLAHFRACVPGGPERQLALFAAIERAVFRGEPAACPPAYDDPLDQLLCDVLEAIDRHPDLKNRGASYGADRHLTNLQALGVWQGKPLASEFFARVFSHLSRDADTTFPACEGNFSPASQGSRPNGDLIEADSASSDAAGDAADWPQAMAGVELATQEAGEPETAAVAESGGLIRHATENPGEKIGGVLDPLSPGVHAGQSAGDAGPPAGGRGLSAAPRPVRRGRPLVLDDMAKGRVLGLMSHGLSFRQAAAQLGVHHQTLLNALKRDEEFAQQVAEARLDALSQPLMVVVQAARTNWRAAAWLARFLNDRRASSYETTPEERELLRLRG